MRTITDTLNTTVNTIIDNTTITHIDNTILPINLDEQPHNQDHNNEQEEIFL